MEWDRPGLKAGLSFQPAILHGPVTSPFYAFVFSFKIGNNCNSLKGVCKQLMRCMFLIFTLKSSVYFTIKSQFGLTTVQVLSHTWSLPCRRAHPPSSRWFPRGRWSSWQCRTFPSKLVADAEWAAAKEVGSGSDECPKGLGERNSNSRNPLNLFRNIFWVSISGYNHNALMFTYLQL